MDSEFKTEFCKNREGKSMIRKKIACENIGKLAIGDFRKLETFVEWLNVTEIKNIGNSNVIINSR